MFQDSRSLMFVTVCNAIEPIMAVYQAGGNRVRFPTGSRRQKREAVCMLVRLWEKCAVECLLHNLNVAREMMIIAEAGCMSPHRRTDGFEAPSRSDVEKPRALTSKAAGLPQAKGAGCPNRK